MSEPLPPSAYDQEDLQRHYNNYNVKTGRYKFIIDQLQPKSKILEVGCFLGRYCNHFQSLGHAPVGVDLSHYAIDEGKKLFPELDLRCIDARGLEHHFEANTFDYVVASEVIEHVLYPQDFLKGILHVLKPGGQLLLTTQNSNAFQYRVQMIFGQFRWDPTHLRLYSKPELRQEIETGGFHIESFTPIPISTVGKQKILRYITYISNYVHSSFCWTWGVVATKKA